jgi:hypothetical protein
MRKRSLAIWPGAAPRPRAAEMRPIPLQEEQWNQEQEKHLNERREVESAQEKMQRLAPGFDYKRMVL